MKKWVLSVLLFSVAVNVSVLATLVYYWKKNSNPKTTMLWHTVDVDTVGADKIMVFNHISPDDSNRIVHFKHQWSDQIDNISGKIDTDRQRIIRLMLKEPPDRDSIAVVIDSMVVKQVRAEQYTVDHLLEIRDLMPRERWQELVKSLDAPSKIIIHKKLSSSDDRNHKAIIEVNGDVRYETLDIRKKK